MLGAGLLGALPYIFLNYVRISSIRIRVRIRATNVWWLAKKDGEALASLPMAARNHFSPTIALMISGPLETSKQLGDPGKSSQLSILSNWEHLSTVFLFKVQQIPSQTRRLFDSLFPIRTAMRDKGDRSTRLMRRVSTTPSLPSIPLAKISAPQPPWFHRRV